MSITPKNLFNALFESKIPAGLALFEHSADDEQDVANSAVDEDAIIAAHHSLQDLSDMTASLSTRRAGNRNDDFGSEQDELLDEVYEPTMGGTTDGFFVLDEENEAVKEGMLLAGKGDDDEPERGEVTAEEERRRRLRTDFLASRKLGPLSRGKQAHSQDEGANMRRVRSGRSLTAEEQVALMPPDGTEYYVGSCVLHDHRKGFGFVSPDVGGPDVYYTRDLITLKFSKLVVEVLGDPSLSLLISDEVKAGIEAGLQFLELTRPFLVGSERVEFRSSWNQGANREANSNARRKLRAIDISGVAQGPIQLERVLFGLTKAANVIPETLPDGTKSSEHPDPRVVQLSKPLEPMTDSKGNPSPWELCNTRFEGWVKSFPKGSDRGYIRPMKSNNSLDPTSTDAMMNADCLVWDTSVAASRRVMEEGVIVEYTIIQYDHMRKPLAAVVTAPGGRPLNPDTWELTEAARKRKHDDNERGGSGTGRKREREDVVLLGDDGGYNDW